MKLKLTSLVLCMVTLVSCNKYKVTTTEDGDRLQVHEKGKSGKIGKEGDIINFDLVIKTATDSVLNDTYKAGAPFTAPLQKGYFKGSFENALFHIAEGDSTTVLVYADSLYKLMGQPVPEFIGKGKDIRFIVKMHKIQTQEEHQKEIADKKAQEPKLMADYVAKNLVGATQTAEGLFVKERKAGAGDAIVDGDKVTVKYVGRFMDGKEFDKGDSLKLEIGSKRVISGWELALKTMKKGSESTFVIPSAQAYGEQGAGPISPNTPLVFDITVLDVVKK